LVSCRQYGELIPGFVSLGFWGVTLLTPAAGLCVWQCNASSLRTTLHVPCSVPCSDHAGWLLQGPPSSTRDDGSLMARCLQVRLGHWQHTSKSRMLCEVMNVGWLVGLLLALVPQTSRLSHTYTRLWLLATVTMPFRNRAATAACGGSKTGGGSMFSAAGREPCHTAAHRSDAAMQPRGHSWRIVHIYPTCLPSWPADWPQLCCSVGRGHTLLIGLGLFFCQQQTGRDSCRALRVHAPLCSLLWLSKGAGWTVSWCLPCTCVGSRLVCLCTHGSMIARPLLPACSQDFGAQILL
jgi:hypothetical protein